MQEQDAATKAAVHGVIGGVLSAALGGKAAAGAVGGTLTSLAVDTLGQKLDALNLSPDNRDAILLAVSGVLGKVSGAIISPEGQVGNVAAFTAMQATEYNYLSHWQEKTKAIEKAQCTSVWCRIGTAAKWALVSTEQNSAFITGMATSIPDMVLETAEGIVHIATHPTETYQAIKQLLSSEDIIGTVSQAIRQNYIERFNKIAIEYERAGSAGAYYAGLEAGKVVTDAFGVLAGGVGIAKGAVKLTGKLAGIVVKQGENTLKQAAINSNTIQQTSQSSASVDKFSDGVSRAQKYSANWASANLDEAVEKFAGKNPIITTTIKGKRIYEHPETGLQVVEDTKGNYFRIYDSKISGERNCLDLNGKIPNNKVLENGKQMGRSKGEYYAATHFNIKKDN